LLYGRFLICLAVLPRVVDHSSLIHPNFGRTSSVRRVSHSALWRGVSLPVSRPALAAVAVEGQVVLTSIESSGLWDDGVAVSRLVPVVLRRVRNGWHGTLAGLEGTGVVVTGIGSVLGLRTCLSIVCVAP